MSEVHFGNKVDKKMEIFEYFCDLVNNAIIPDKKANFS